MSVQAVSMQTPPPAATVAKQGGGELAASTVETPKVLAPRVEAPKANASRQELEQAVEAVKKFVQPMASNLDFSIDEETGIRVVKVIDTSTKEVIRQFPSEEILQIAQTLDRLQGLLIKQQA